MNTLLFEWGAAPSPAATLGEAQFRFLAVRFGALLRDAAVRLDMVKIAFYQKNKVDCFKKC